MTRGPRAHPRSMIDPESLGPLLDLLAERPGFHDLPLEERRNQARAWDDARRVPLPDGVDLTIESTSRPDGEGDLPLRVYRPHAPHGPAPLLVYVHGGGMIMGSAASEDPLVAQLCADVGAVVVSVDYRLAPEHPYPAALHDCVTAWRWAHRHAADLGSDPDRTAIVGASAGGGLAIATALVARDQGLPRASLLMAMYPMIDDRCSTPSSHEIVDLGTWDRRPNQQAWAWYLAGRSADGYAAPARAEELAGLPPTFVDVGTVDLFRDEDITFAQRLLQDGVPTELHVYPGAYHASEHLAPDAALSRRIRHARVCALRRALASDRQVHRGPTAGGDRPR